MKDWDQQTKGFRFETSEKAPEFMETQEKGKNAGCKSKELERDKNAGTPPPTTHKTPKMAVRPLYYWYIPLRV